jgi:hypothetical protein
VSEDVQIGPIDYLIVEWPKGKEPNGAALPHLIDAVDRGIVRILDIAFVQKGEDGSIVAVDLEDFNLSGDPHLSVLAGASSGLLGDDDYDEAGNAIEPGCSAALLIYENTWAAPFATALRSSGAQLVASGRIPVDAVMAALDELGPEQDA